MKYIYFSGIGGIGTSALARYFLSQGTSTVFGSDSVDSDLLLALEREGATIFRKQSLANIPKECDVLVYSEAVPEKNPERMEAKKRGIPQRSYFAMMGDISKKHKTIAIAGTHGKTTVTAMLAQVMMPLDPTVIVGSKIPCFEQQNFRQGTGGYFVVEACEYRESFLHLDVFGAIIPSCEPDHLDYYKTAERYFQAFKTFVSRIPKEGFLVIPQKDTNSVRIAKHAKCRVVEVPESLKNLPELSVPGAHNRMNASLAVTAAKLVGMTELDCLKHIQEFTGTWRRFERKGEKDGVEVYDDYAHHPTEILVTLQAAREKFPQKKLVIIFQPHQYSRTREFFDGFAQSFSDADVVLVPNIYEVRDSAEDISMVSAELLVEKMCQNGTNAFFTDGFNNTLAVLPQYIDKNTVLFTMGAGPVYEVGERYLRG